MARKSSQSSQDAGPGPAQQDSAKTLGGDAVDLHANAHTLQIGLATDPGRIRSRNEDASLALQFTLVQQGQPPLPVGLFIIADGMGGHLQGQRASALACRLAAAHVIRHVCLPMLGDEQGMGERTPIHEVLEAGMRNAHQAILHHLPEAGTTMTMVLTLGDGAYLAHIGDTRAYLGDRDGIQPLTRDHSMAARLVEMGQASYEEAAPQRNILYKALGHGTEIEPDILYHDLEQGQYLLLCCDGLWGTVVDEEMAAIIAESPAPDIACQNLVAHANRQGGEDNISAILAARGWPPRQRE